VLRDVAKRAEKVVPMQRESRVLHGIYL
jgi:hypothetical protein